MPLADDVAALRDHILSDLNDAHDYYTHTKAAWRIVQRVIDKGATVTVRNTITGSVITEADLPGTAQTYVTGYLAATTLQQFVSSFEDFVLRFLRYWLHYYPQRLERKQVPMSLVLSAANLDEVRMSVINRELNELTYKKVRDWFAYLEDMAKLGCPTEDEIDRLAEIKATRDVFVHNRGIASATYEEKAGAKKRAVAGARLEISESYHRESWELIRKVMTDVTAAALDKV